MIWLIIAYTLNVVDFLFTAYWVSLYGIEIEANPIAKWLFTHDLACGVKILAEGVLFVLLGYFITRNPKLAWVAYIPLTVYSALVIYHIVIAINLR